MDNYLLNVAIFGAGGSGPSAQRALIINKLIHIAIILGADDSGGSTGVVNEVMALIDLSKFSANQRFQDRRKILPIGDTRNNILRILNYTRENGRTIADLLDKRLPDDIDLAAEVKDIIGKVFQELGIQEGVVDLQDMNNFIDEYLRAYYEYKDEILKRIQAKSNFDVPKLKDLSVGNLFLMYFFLTSDSHEHFFDRLKEIGIVPHNIDFHYISEFRQILLGTNNEGETVVHEHNIDVSTRPMMPGAYSLSQADENGLPTTFVNRDDEEEFAVLSAAKVDEKIKQIILGADVLFASTGSLSNLFAQARVLAETISEFKGLLIHVANFARNENEFHSQYALDRLYKLLQVPFVTLLVNSDLSSKIFSDQRLRLSYSRQDKYFNEAKEVFNYLVKNHKSTIFAKRILPILNLIHSDEQQLDLAAEDFIDRGIKHEPQEIADITIFFGLIYKLIDFLDLPCEKDLYFNQIIDSLQFMWTDENEETHIRFENGELNRYLEFLRDIAIKPELDINQKLGLIKEVGTKISKGENIDDIILELRSKFATEIDFK